MGNSIDNSQDNTHCSIVGLRGILIQVSLGVLSFSVLIIKRFFENPRRPWKIWRFDTVKQVISQLLAHFINLTISLALTSQDPDSDTCLWYFITNVFDNTVGVLICVLSLRIIEKQLFKKHKYELISGNYYQISQGQRKQRIQAEHHEVEEQLRIATTTFTINYKAWMFQLLIWNAIVVVAKVLLFGLQFLLENQLDLVSKFLLGWIEAYPTLELIVVIVIVPVIMNGFAFWVQDNFLKKRLIPKEPNDICIELQDQSHKDSVPRQIQEHPENGQAQKQTEDEVVPKQNQIIVQLHQ